MGIARFIIDGAEYPVADVLSGNVPTRFPEPFLLAAAEFRAWDGKPHVTDLLNGDRLTWLKNKRDYAVDPDDAAYRVLGVGTHGALENQISETALAEVSLASDDVQGRTDLIQTMNGKRTMVDYKVVGSYKIQQALGIYYQDVPSLDADGNEQRFKSGARAGQVKTHKVVMLDKNKADIKEWARQLNIYRVLEKMSGNPEPEQLFIFAIVRDGGTKIAMERGVIQKTYTIPIPVVQDDKVLAFVKNRSDAIKAAMALDTPPPMCSNEECWNGRRCAEFCEVSGHCRAIGDNPFLRGEEATDEGV